MSCSEVEIRTGRPKKVNTDGEITTETPAQFRVLRQVVSVFAPTAEKDIGERNNQLGL